MRKQFEASAVKIGGLGTTCEFHSPDPGVVRKNIDETKEWVKLAKDIGSPSVKVRPNGLRKDVPEDQTLEQIGKALAECGAFARDNGIVIQLEVHGPRPSACRGSGRSWTTAAITPTSAPAGIRTRRTCSTAGFDANFKLLRDQIGQVHMRDLSLEEYPWKQLVSRSPR